MEAYMYTTEYLLDCLRIKYNELGRSPSKEELSLDERMPNPSTYRDRFGGITKACLLLGLVPSKALDLTLEKMIVLAQTFFTEQGHVPGPTDFDEAIGYPHSSYIRKDLGLTWNRFLQKAGLPTFTNGHVWIKNRKAELFIKQKLLQSGYCIDDLSAENSNAKYSFVVNQDITIDVRYSSPILERNLSFWKFKLHRNDKKYIPDYYIGVGGNDQGDFKATFVFPTQEINAKEVISINMYTIDRSKYAEYLIDGRTPLILNTMKN